MTPSPKSPAAVASAPPGVVADQIDIGNADAVQEWAAKLDVTNDQVRDAVAKVGPRAADVEMHLKGSRSTTNSDRVEEVAGSAGKKE